MRRRLLDKSRSWTRKSSEVSAPVAIIVGGEIDGKAALLAAVSKDLVKRGLKGGGGGGRTDLAEAGGKEPGNLNEALAAGLAVYREAVGQAF